MRHARPPGLASFRLKRASERGSAIDEITAQRRVRYRGVAASDTDEFVALWVRERARAKARIALHLGTAYNILASLLDPLYVLPENLVYFQSFHAASLIAVIFWWVALRHTRYPLSWFVYPLQVSTVAFFSFVLHRSLMLEAPLEPVFNGAALLGITTLLLPICPFNNAIVPLTAVLYIAMHIAGWGGVHEDSLRWLAIVSFAMASALFFHYYHLHQTRREARLEYDARHQILSKARLKMEHELELARDIQESLAPPPERLLANDVRVHCYQVKNDQVGGDWMALRPLSDGRMVAVVADATGKGISAALVVHAVQSLWADEMSYETFDPEKWISRVNRTLCRLGERKPHSLTLGVLVLGAESLTYWSAGHLPLFLLTGEETEPEVRAVSARGPMLGLKPEIELKPTTYPIPSGPFEILLATDGVLEHGSRSSPREVKKLLAALKIGRRAAIEIRPGDDDKTLVWLRRGAA